LGDACHSLSPIREALRRRRWNCKQNLVRSTDDVNGNREPNVSCIQVQLRPASSRRRGGRCFPVAVSSGARRAQRTSGPMGSGRGQDDGSPPPPPPPSSPPTPPVPTLIPPS